MSGEDFRGQPFQIITSDLKLKQFKCSMKKKKKKGKTSPVPAPQIWAPRVLVLCDSKRHTFQVWTTARTKHNISRCHWGFLEHVTGFYFATRKIVCSPQKWAGISGTSWRILELNGLQKEKLHSVRLNSSRVVLHLPARNPYEKKVQTDVSLAADCVYCHRVDRRRKLCSDMTTTDTRAQLGLFFFFFPIHLWTWCLSFKSHSNHKAHYQSPNIQISTGAWTYNTYSYRLYFLHGFQLSPLLYSLHTG